MTMSCDAPSPRAKPLPDLDYVCEGRKVRNERCAKNLSPVRSK